MPQDAEWRILAEEASQENDPKKLVEIIEALTRALDQQQHKEKAVSTSLTPANCVSQKPAASYRHRGQIKSHRVSV